MRYATHPLIYPDIVEDREYQLRIAEAAADSNTLVVLPTALGKTVISALVAANVPYNYSDKRVPAHVAHEATGDAAQGHFSENNEAATGILHYSYWEDSV
jgi:hypothetical protein